MQKIILASRSPRRKQLLEWAEVPFEVLVKETDESYPLDLSAEKVAIHIARNKGLAVQTCQVFKDLTGLPHILAADTIVVLHNKIIGKPGNRKEAIEILSNLFTDNVHDCLTQISL